MAQHWTAEELRDCGVSKYEIRKRLEAGTLYRLSRGIYTAQRPEPETALRALQHRHRGLIFSGITAAGIYGLVPITAPAQAALPHGSHPIHNAALHARPSRRRTRRRINGIAVTSPIAVVAELFPDHDFWELVKFLETHYDGLRAAQQFDADVQSLTPAQRSHIEPLLKRTVIGASSRMERLFIADLRKTGLDPIANFKLGPYHWDIGFPHGTTVIDLDSRIFHTAGPDNPVDNAFIIDRWKTNHATHLGWAGLRYTDICIRRIPEEVIEQIRRTVGHRRATSGLRRTPRQIPGMREQGVWGFHPELFY